MNWTTVSDNTSVTPANEVKVSRQFVSIYEIEQRQRLSKAREECSQQWRDAHNSTLHDDTAANRCEMVWDNILCWGAAPAGTLQQQRCPGYIDRFDTNEYATKFCTPNGTWFKLYENGSHWTNFTACLVGYTYTKTRTEHAEKLELIQNIGYGVSLCSLVIAVFLMICSRLKSKSNTLHVNLFFAFILRACLSFAQKLLFVRGLGMKKDVEVQSDGAVKFITQGLHWECRLLHTAFLYTICASQMWIFVEGLYLHMLIYRTLSTERNGVKPYIFLGWVLPLAVITPWIIVKVVADNTHCWNVPQNHLYIWILHGPMLATVLLNFGFFLNISRVLCSRVRSSQRHMGRSKYRHLVKFILVLIPLFGVFYIVSAVAFPYGYINRFDITQLYVEQTYNAFQGFLLALLFCFLNEEVHSGIKRIWWRWRTGKRGSVATRSYVMSSFKRNSYNNQPPMNGSELLRFPVRHPSTESTYSDQPTLVTRLKTHVFRWLGRDKNKGNSRVLKQEGEMTDKDSFYVSRQSFDCGDTSAKIKDQHGAGQGDEKQVETTYFKLTSADSN